MPRPKKRRGRPPKLVMPTRLDGVTPEQVADMVMSGTLQLLQGPP